METISRVKQGVSKTTIDFTPELGYVDSLKGFAIRAWMKIESQQDGMQMTKQLKNLEKVFHISR